MGIRNAILVADDSADDALLLKLALKKAKVVNAVFTVPDGEEAIAYLKGEGQYADREQYPFPVLLLVDLLMPRKSGFDVLAWLKENPKPKLGVVVLSGVTEVKEMTRASALGAHSFLIKPLHVQDFLNLVHAIKDIRIKGGDEGYEVEFPE